jgi:hypothetical protein
MTPDPDPDFATQCAALCPGFRAIAAPRRARKSELLAGELDGAPVFAKRLRRPSAVWGWYLAREIELYRAFAVTPPPLRVPRFVAAGEGLLVIERLAGAPVAKLRRPEAQLDAPEVRSLVAMHDAFAAWPGRCPVIQPAPAVRAQLRTRLLEDPTDRGWIEAGLGRCGARGLLDAITVRCSLDALGAHAPVAASHGDLLLRNVIRIDGALAVVDWECAGAYVADWDLALLWTQLAAPGREVLEAAIGGGPRQRALLALVAFALGRERAFLQAFRVGARHRASTRLADELTAVSARLRDG